MLHPSVTYSYYNQNGSTQIEIARILLLHCGFLCFFPNARNLFLDLLDFILVPTSLVVRYLSFQLGHLLEVFSVGCVTGNAKKGRLSETQTLSGNGRWYARTHAYNQDPGRTTTPPSAMILGTGPPLSFPTPIERPVP